MVPLATMPIKNGQQGFIALISVIVLGFVLMITVLTLGSRGIGSRFALLDLERKEASDALARGCVEVARVVVVNDATYEIAPSAPVHVEVGSSQCTIRSIDAGTPSSGFSLVQVSASSTGATTNLEIVVDSATGNVNSWKERVNF